MLPSDLCIQSATTALCSLLVAWLGLWCQPVSCLALLHWAPLLAMTHYCLLLGVLGEILGRAGPRCMGSASASLAEDEGLFLLSPEAYISPTESHFTRSGKAVEKGLTWGIWLGLQDGKKHWWAEEQNGDSDINLSNWCKFPCYC